MEESIKLLLGKVLINGIKEKESWGDIEFSVFSQFGDDGIIQYLINKIRPETEFFVEFGVENYLESNTRFLMQNNNWSGMVMDASKEYIDFIKAQGFYWRHNLQAIHSFITAENINSLLAGLPKKIGLLHIDIDGNDYWIWKAIEAVTADIVVVEYNSVFGYERCITIPYQSDFYRTKAHYSNLYAGASLGAFCKLANEKGYSFVGSNSAGNNAYFVLNEKMGSLKALTVSEGYRVSKFRESRDKMGNLTYIAGDERLALIKGLPVVNVLTNKLEKL